MHVLWARSCRKCAACGLSLLEQSETLSDCSVAGVKLGGACVCVDSVRDLIIAALVEAPKIEPNLRNVWVDPYRSGVSIKGVPVLIDLEVEYADGAPEGRVPAVAIDGLLVRLVRFVVLLARHVSTTKKVPTLSVSGVCCTNQLEHAIREDMTLPASKLFVRYWMATS